MHKIKENPYKDWANYVFCDNCKKSNIHQDPRGFFNCKICQYDNCIDCGITRADTLLIEISDQNELCNNFAI